MLFKFYFVFSGPFLPNPLHQEMCSLNIRREASVSGLKPGQEPGPGAGSVGILSKTKRTQVESARYPRGPWGVWGRGVGPGPDWRVGWGCDELPEHRGGWGMGITRPHPLLSPTFPQHPATLPRGSPILLDLSKLLDTSGAADTSFEIHF